MIGAKNSSLKSLRKEERSMPNWRKMKKDDLVWFATHKCRHGHTYMEHPNCIDSEKPSRALIEKVGHFDIEATGLNADFDFIISYAIKVGDEVWGRVLTPAEVKSKEKDKKLVKEMCEHLRQLDRVIVYYGSNHRFDLPFARSRCEKWGNNFPVFGEIFITDAYDIARNKLRLSRNRLENVARFLGIPAKGHPLDGDVWLYAKYGDKKSLDYVWVHNKEDVDTLEAVYERLRKYVREPRTSI